MDAAEAQFLGGAGCAMAMTSGEARAWAVSAVEAARRAGWADSVWPPRAMPAGLTLADWLHALGAGAARVAMPLGAFTTLRARCADASARADTLAAAAAVREVPLLFGGAADAGWSDDAHARVSQARRLANDVVVASPVSSWEQADVSAWLAKCRDVAVGTPLASAAAAFDRSVWLAWHAGVARRAVDR